MEVRSSRMYLPDPDRTARASISLVHSCPFAENVARDQAQREKACAIAPVTPLRAWAFAATCASGSGDRPGTVSCPSFHRAACRCVARGSLGAIRHRSSAAGHKPKRKITRAASAAACVPTWAPIDAVVAELIAGTQRGLRWAVSWVF